MPFMIDEPSKSSLIVTNSGPEKKSDPSNKVEKKSETELVFPERQKKISLLQRLISWLGQEEPSLLYSDLNDVFSKTHSKHELSCAEQAMLDSILRLSDVRVEDVMIPRADIEAVEIRTTLGDLMNLFERSKHSRMPVYSLTLDDPKGMIHIRDILAYIVRSSQEVNAKQNNKGKKIKSFNFSCLDLEKTVGELNLIRKTLFAPPSMPVSDLIGLMQTSRTQMALVIDEYGGTDGLVSFEDLVEVLVGNIQDEHDNETPGIVEVGKGVFMADAKAEIEDALKIIGPNFSVGEHADHVDTIGGIILSALGHVPSQGEVLSIIPGFEFHIIDSDVRRVKRVRIVYIGQEKCKI